MPNAALQWLRAACTRLWAVFTSETGATQSIGKEMMLIWLASASLFCGKANTFNSTLDLHWPLFQMIWQHSAQDVQRKIWFTSNSSYWWKLLPDQNLSHVTRHTLKPAYQLLSFCLTLGKQKPVNNLSEYVSDFKASCHNAVRREFHTAKTWMNRSDQVNNKEKEFFIFYKTHFLNIDWAIKAYLKSVKTFQRSFLIKTLRDI